LEYSANLASKNESHLFITHVIEEFGELIQRWEQHDSYVEEVKRLSSLLLDQGLVHSVASLQFLSALFEDKKII
jgi:hypothetical protein